MTTTASYFAARTIPTRRAYGGIVLSRQGTVLLCRSAGMFNGVAWTFPKGGADAGESDRDAAVREVLEETGLRCEIIGKLSGAYVGTDSVTEYFLMRPTGRRQAFGDETDAVAWVAIDDVLDYLDETISPVGYRRDRAVLAQLFRTLKHV